MTTLLPVPRLTPATMRVYVAICCLADVGTPCTYRAIACITGRCHQHVEQHINKLESAGLIATGRRKERASIRPLYRILKLNGH